MNCRQARELLVQQKTEGSPPRPELERHLQQCPNCQSWFARQRRIVRELEQVRAGQPAKDLARQVLERLPDMPPAALQQAAGLVRRAWQDPGLRDALRTAPRQALEREGVALPPGLQVVVVSPEEATLPTRQVLSLPLPRPGEGPRSAADLHARLRFTPAASWLEPELAGRPVTDRMGDVRDRVDTLLDRARLAGDGLLSGLRRPGPGRLLAPALAVAAALLLLFGLLATFQNQGTTTTPGAAVGTGPWAAAAGLVVLLAVVALLLWRRRR
jgi:MYXO-CTERM domain-containing protein